uniref:Uncharacterized protein n=1 Tax=viral metagenome TaxID=1070528 RepID=A0A6C0KS06_9ZZZZ
MAFKVFSMIKIIVKIMLHYYNNQYFHLIE